MHLLRARVGGYRRRSVITPRRRFPGVDVVVHTRGVGGRSAAQMLAPAVADFIARDKDAACLDGQILADRKRP